ncbi:CPBP family intramembrane glutamic endopeptidase [Streptococcus ruminantium]|uniref:CPBP family intramembrane glutamic endopeptidase n=1 Tax=Streptococcus ruminantium TaxID=1917441 RepID=A0ABU1B4Y2_9STRE|nr:CPBP family intramembrane glutamic endopeptidase [Streptococcus ruminantium]MDQ8758864.1 CPBP family intramembrane glutamic endopeptidase [Streptococcus ruminantium]MDQ8768220.1 CPBP family intramembrane glutamic endopeptidase [Streptococcus ruminantium]MDQ8774701.1 CPBP family intramembrane glutamic endopeptidase [Streptococcus ruminantium]MDQ8793586.1 CPBP family intramembrane glutamic endopeptidase [Streptococcus ruminantium]MDQ8795578.1 CPBP family intramembrane glutamic endopeptidase [
MIRIVLFYLAIQFNGFLLSIYMEEYMTIEVLVLLQMLLLGVVCLEISHHKTVQAKNMTLKNRLRWLLLGFACMVAVAVFISFLFPVHTRNQAVLLQVGEQVPHFIFLLFLVNASVLEEIVYRQLLWEKLTFPFVQIGVTSFLFVLSHGPNQLGSWLMYSCLGLTLAAVRLKTDCMMAIALHLLWNSLTYVVTFL